MCESMKVLTLNPNGVFSPAGVWKCRVEQTAKSWDGQENNACTSALAERPAVKMANGSGQKESYGYSPGILTL